MMFAPIVGFIFSASMRAIRSPALPGGNGTTKRIGFEGYGCAVATTDQRAMTSEKASRFIGASLNCSLQGRDAKWQNSSR